MHETIKIKKLHIPLIQIMIFAMPTVLLWLKPRATIFNRA